jgi:PKD repeat protein
VTVTDSNGCIYHAGPDTVIVDPLPHAIMSYVDKDSALTFDFYNVSLYSTSCKWNFGDPSTGSLNTSFSNDTLHVYTSPGKYTVELIVMNNCGSDTTFDTINVHKPNTGINQIEELSGLFLYPNPAKDFVNLNFILDKPKQLSITLYNALGQKMYFENVSYNSGIHHEEINLESLSKGVYIFRIFADEQTYNLKLIKN